MDIDGSRPRWINLLTDNFNSSMNYLYIILIIVLIFLSAFFAASETAFSCCNKTRIRSKAEEGDSKAKKVLKVIDNFEKYLVSILIYTNICHILCSTIATILAINLMGEIGSLVSTIIITLLVFIFSETLPKNIAKANADRLVYSFYFPMKLVTYLVYPFVLLFALPFKLIKKNEEDNEYVEEDLPILVESIQDEGVLDTEESNLIQNAIEFDDTVAKEIYTPIKDVISISKDLTLDDFIKRILDETKYTRIPVYQNEKDNIVGVVFVRPALKKILNNKNITKDDLISKPHFVKYSTKLDDLLADLLKNKVHMGIVRDSNNKVLGIITMDDILDELVGEIDKGSDNHE